MNEDAFTRFEDAKRRGEAFYIAPYTGVLDRTFYRVLGREWADEFCAGLNQSPGVPVKLRVYSQAEIDELRAARTASTEAAG